jgi:hypothetical protein
MANVHDSMRTSRAPTTSVPQASQHSKSPAYGASSQQSSYLDVAANAAKSAQSLFGWGASLLGSTSSRLAEQSTAMLHSAAETTVLAYGKGRDLAKEKGGQLIETSYQMGKEALEKGGGGGLQLANNVVRVGLMGASYVAPSLAEGIERVTVFGMLPNTPKFETALQEKTTALAPMVNAAATGASTGVKTVIGALQDAHADAASTRGGKPINLTNDQFSCALLLGAHFVKQDGGALYDTLRQTADENGKNLFQPRTSSHYDSTQSPQFGADLPGGMGHLLIGKTDSGDTFFQLESHGVGGEKSGWDETLGHAKGYAQHISSDDHFIQMGPQGCIAASEKDKQHIVLQ